MTRNQSERGETIRFVAFTQTERRQSSQAILRCPTNLGSPKRSQANHPISKTPSRKPDSYLADSGSLAAGCMSNSPVALSRASQPLVAAVSNKPEKKARTISAAAKYSFLMSAESCGLGVNRSIHRRDRISARRQSQPSSAPRHDVEFQGARRSRHAS